MAICFPVERLAQGHGLYIEVCKLILLLLAFRGCWGQKGVDHMYTGHCTYNMHAFELQSVAAIDLVLHIHNALWKPLLAVALHLMCYTSCQKWELCLTGTTLDLKLQG